MLWVERRYEFPNEFGTLCWEHCHALTEQYSDEPRFSTSIGP
jgi:hypothetical protein